MGTKNHEARRKKDLKRCYENGRAIRCGLGYKTESRRHSVERVRKRKRKWEGVDRNGV